MKRYESKYVLHCYIKMASKKKKVVSKDELRRLMKEKKFSTNLNAKKIDHPLAKYNSLDQLVCSLCNSVVKSNLLWPAHIQSKQHKEKLELMMTAGPAVGKASATKRSGSYSSEQPAEKRIKDSHNGHTFSTNSGKRLPADFSDNSQGGIVQSKTTGLAAYSSSEDEEEDMDATPKPADPLPPDFFDNTKSEGSSQSEVAVASSSHAVTMSEALPEGFFDDPVMDAKVRKVEYKDKMEEEWEMFQKAMKEETHVSEAIIEEEDEQVNVDRNIDEIDDQMNRWKEIHELAVKKESVMQHTVSKDNTSDSTEDMDEEELEDFMNWRSKKSWK